MTEINNTQEISISDDFQILEQSYSESALCEQRNRIVAQSLSPAFKTWSGYLLFDFQSFDLCQSLSITPVYEELTFQTKHHALSWVCTHQLERNDLSEEYKKYLIGKKYSLEVSIQKDNRSKILNEPQISTFSISKNSKTGIAKMIGDELGIKLNTVQKYNVYSEAVDRLLVIVPEFAKKILNGKLRISHKSIVKLAEQPREMLIKIMSYVDDNNIDHLGYSELTNDFQWKNIQSNPISPKQIDEEPKIRQMPEYDPDAQISSITLTIPSWVSSMERAHKRTDYSKTTPSARINLVKQLAILERTIYIIQKEIEEVL